jgi:hypothetical protein
MSETYTNTVSGRRMQLSGAEIKVFDPLDPASGSGSAELCDACVVNRENLNWIYLAGQARGYGATEIYSASLTPKAPLSAQGWTRTRNSAGELEPLTGHSMSSSWDGKGGRHCPSTTQVRRRIFGDLIRLASCNGMESSGSIRPNLLSLPIKNGSTAVFMSRTLCITTVDGRYGMSPDLTMRITLYTVMRRARTAGQVGPNMRCLRRQK